MKNLYFLDEEEKNRILSIHENEMKKQYLIETPETDYLRKLPKETQDKFNKLGNSWKAMGTNPANLLSTLKTFTPDDYLKYKKYLIQFKPEGHTSFQGIINGEMEYNNLPDVINIAKELKRFGVNATYKTVTKDKYGGTLSTPGFEVNSFRTNSGGNTANVVKQPETKTQVADPKIVQQQKVQQRRKQITQQTQNTTKEIQKLLGQDVTGNLDSLNVERMIDLLKQ